MIAVTLMYVVELKNMIKQSLILALILTSVSLSYAGEIKIAVASNFANAAIELSSRFEQETGHKVKISIGSTGKQYAQILNGAPFDLYFAADSHRPKLLEEKNRIISGTRFIYAQGKLVLWSPEIKTLQNQKGLPELSSFNYLAIANPRLAPYGSAAKEVLLALGAWSKLPKKMVRGENIGQTFQYVVSGNAELGFVSYSQIIGLGKNYSGSYWVIPQKLYTPIHQQAVLLKDTKIARDFLQYVKSETGKEVINRFGYRVTETGNKPSA